MKRSEKVLLGLFSILFLVIIGGGVLAFGIQNYRDLLEENAGLKDRLIEMNEAIAQGSEWQRRSEWLEAHVPAFTSRQEASTRLLEAIQREAEKSGLTIGGKEFLEPVKQLGPDGLPVEAASGYHDQAAVRITLANAKEQTLFAWMHALQQPDAFLGITRLQINPSGQGKTVNVEVEVTQFYRERPAAKITKADKP